MSICFSHMVLRFKVLIVTVLFLLSLDNKERFQGLGFPSATGYQPGKNKLSI